HDQEHHGRDRRRLPGRRRRRDEGDLRHHRRVDPHLHRDRARVHGPDHAHRLLHRLAVPTSGGGPMNLSVLFDTPGPRGRMRNHLLTAVSVLVIGAIGYWVYQGFDAKGQFEGQIWKPFLEANTWQTFIIPGLIGTLRAAGAAAVLALVFGAVFGLARLSDHAWIRIPAGIVVEVFRAIPLLLLIFFIFFLLPMLAG